MILGHLIQAGRHFCECRPRDFIPGDETTLVAIAYSIHDEFTACSFDIDRAELLDEIRSWLNRQEALGYLIVRREPENKQIELPQPVGRTPMDQITMIAATENEFETVPFLLEPTRPRGSYRLLRTNLARPSPGLGARNLFQRYEAPSSLSAVPFLPDFADSLR